jgi:hypothetical protein
MLESISLDARRRHSGENVWNEPLAGMDRKWVQRERPEKLIERAAFICLAGPAALRRINPHTERDPGCKNTIKSARLLLELLPDSPKKQAERRRRIEVEANRLMKHPGIWARTQHLAEVLLSRGSISGEEATEILQNAGKL